MTQPTLVVSLPPHEASRVSVATIMWSVVIALIPALIAGFLTFGIRSLVVTLVAVAACVVTEHFVARVLLRVETTPVSDGSAVVTGMLLAFNVPAGIPLWQIIVGSVVAIGVAKMAFGGIGNNPFNPALIGRAFMLASFPVDMTTWPTPGAARLFSWSVDAVTGPTPLSLVKEGGADVIASGSLPGYWDLFVGTIGGCIGEASALAVLIGGVFLLARGFIVWQAPIFYLLGLAGVTGVFWLVDPAAYADPLYHLLAGGAMLGAWFMVTDMTTSPMSTKGKVVFAFAGGVLAAVIRLVGGFPEGVSYSILIMNAFVPVIDRHLKPRKFGYGGRS